jgi:hypothetical protein
MSSFDSFRRAIEKVQGPLTPTMGPSFRGRPVPYGITEGNVDLPYDPDAILPPDVPVDQQVIGTTAAITPAPAPTPAPTKDLLAAAEQSVDPYGSLSKTQKRMLAFAAISDAGMALQGKEGTKVATLMGDFTKRADQARKERQAQIILETEQARREQLMQMLMGAGTAMPTSASTGAGDMTAAQIEQKIAELTGQLGVYAGLDQLDAFNTNMELLRTQLEDARTKEAAATEKRTVSEGKLTEAKTAMGAARDALGASLGLEGEELDAQLAAMMSGDAELDPSSFFVRRQSFIPDSRRFKEFQAAANQLGAIMTFQNMAEVISAGAKLGILSDSDIRLLGQLSGVIDPVEMPVQTAENIFRLYGKLGETITALEKELAPEDRVNELLKKYNLD